MTQPQCNSTEGW